VEIREAMMADGKSRESGLGGERWMDPHDNMSPNKQTQQQKCAFDYVPTSKGVRQQA